MASQKGLLYVQYDRQGLLDLAGLGACLGRPRDRDRSAEPRANAAKTSFTEIAGDCSIMAAPPRG